MNVLLISPSAPLFHRLRQLLSSYYDLHHYQSVSGWMSAYPWRLVVYHHHHQQRAPMESLLSTQSPWLNVVEHQPPSPSSPPSSNTLRVRSVDDPRIDDRVLSLLQIPRPPSVNDTAAPPPPPRFYVLDGNRHPPAIPGITITHHPDPPPPLRQLSSTLSTRGWPLLYSPHSPSTQRFLVDHCLHLTERCVYLTDSQSSGVGRRGNQWIAHHGALTFSFALPRTALPVGRLVFVQYLVAMAVVRAIRQLPLKPSVDVRLKWPNDALIFGNDQHPQKLSGVLVNCEFFGSEVSLIVGCGVNVYNRQPGVGSLVDALASGVGDGGGDLRYRLLPTILSEFDSMFAQLVGDGFSKFRNEYEQLWLHSGQEIPLENGQRVRVRGLSPTTGQLLADGLGGTTVELHSDGNRVDLWSGLAMQAQKL